LPFFVFNAFKGVSTAFVTIGDIRRQVNCITVCRQTYVQML